jgi:carbamoyl-phosphate synthase/aspartate carbamoyltransferase|tara:strand:+ start:641 stop:1648 length:1008 start_codon:yes stop_codon:yes gene_type:complete
MLSIKNINIEYINKLFKLVADPSLLLHRFPNKILINAFFEPDSRSSSLSFETAMYKLGGNVISFQSDHTNMNKEESFEDTIKILGIYGNAIVLRHPDKNIIEKVQRHSTIPIINGGIGNGEHPTQALIDLYTIHKHLNSIHMPHHITYLENYEPHFESEVLNILFVGDIKNSKKIHSLLSLLYKFNNININFLPYKECEPSDEIITKTMHKCKNKMPLVMEKENLNISKYDIIYCSQFQKEHADMDINPDIIINNIFMSKVKSSAIIMHPLPRNNEINSEVDNDPRCVYFKQIEYGVLIQMAILSNIFCYQDMNTKGYIENLYNDSLSEESDEEL